MFVAKAIRGGATCYRSRLTGTRYTISPRNLVGMFVPAVEGQSMRFCATRAEASHLIEQMDTYIALGRAQRA